MQMLQCTIPQEAQSVAFTLNRLSPSFICLPYKPTTESRGEVRKLFKQVSFPTITEQMPQFSFPYGRSRHDNRALQQRESERKKGTCLQKQLSLPLSPVARTAPVPNHSGASLL